MTESGLIVTNAHVVTSAAAVTGQPHLRVQLHDGATYDATIRDLDTKSDIATIKVNPVVRSLHTEQFELHLGRLRSVCVCVCHHYRKSGMV